MTPICAAAQARATCRSSSTSTRRHTLDDPLLACATHAIFSAESLRRRRTGTAAIQRRCARPRARRRRLCRGHRRCRTTCCGATAATVHAMPAFKITAVDTLAAGDMFHGAFALALTRRAKHACPCVRGGGRGVKCRVSAAVQCADARSDAFWRAVLAAMRGSSASIGLRGASSIRTSSRSSVAPLTLFLRRTGRAARRAGAGEILRRHRAADRRRREWSAKIAAMPTRKTTA